MTTSVVIATLGAVDRRTRLLSVINGALTQDSLIEEVLLVWQGPDDPAFFAQLPAKTRVILEAVPAVCRARNIGARAATGDFVWFLDDDSAPVSRSTLSYALQEMSARNIDFALANIRSYGEVMAAMPIAADVVISRRTLRGNFWEAGLLIKRSVFMLVQYEEKIGIGCLHGSSEGFDLGARLLASGARGVRLKDYVLDHPELSASSVSDLGRYFFYSMGNGAALIRNGFYGLYLYEFVRAGKMFLIGAISGRTSQMKRAIVRVLCLAIGPLVPLLPPIIVPPPPSSSSFASQKNS